MHLHLAKNFLATYSDITKTGVEANQNATFRIQVSGFASDVGGFRLDRIKNYKSLILKSFLHVTVIV